MSEYQLSENFEEHQDDLDLPVIQRVTFGNGKKYYVRKNEVPYLTAEVDDISEYLTQFATRTRYPNVTKIDEDTTKLAIAQAEQVKIWAEKIIAEKSSEQSSQEDETADTTTD